MKARLLYVGTVLVTWVGLISAVMQPLGMSDGGTF